MIDYRVNAINQYADYIMRTRGNMLAGMGEDTKQESGGFLSSIGSFLGTALDKVTPLAETIWNSKNQSARDKAAQKLILEQNKLAATQAQQSALDTLAKREYAEQMNQLQREQARISQGQSDTVLMIGGLTLAALVIAKIMKLI